MLSRLIAASLIIISTTVSAFAEDPIPAKQLFGKAQLPTKGEAQSIGFYAKGCLQGGIAIPLDGPNWQVLHLSRNRRWGNPRMISLIERLSREAHEKDGWNGLLLGDISQPRGGPMLSGHASHQIGLDADIWLTPMPDRKLSYDEREHFPENSVLRKDSLYVDSGKWSPSHMNLIMRAASYPEVERVFVHPGIKKQLCQAWNGNRSLLSKVRPIYGHHYHFHIRMKCPPGSAGCTDQAAPPQTDGCGKELAYWLSDKPWKKPSVVKKPDVKPVKPVKPRYLTLNSLPKACEMVLNAPAVRSAEMAEFRGGGAATPSADLTSMNAYATDTPASAAFDQMEDYSIYVPRGDVPLPYPRPGFN